MSFAERFVLSAVLKEKIPLDGLGTFPELPACLHRKRAGNSRGVPTQGGKPWRCGGARCVPGPDHPEQRTDKITIAISPTKTCSGKMRHPTAIPGAWLRSWPVRYLDGGGLAMGKEEMHEAATAWQEAPVLCGLATTRMKPFTAPLRAKRLPCLVRIMAIRHVHRDAGGTPAVPCRCAFFSTGYAPPCWRNRSGGRGGRPAG